MTLTSDIHVASLIYFVQCIYQLKCKQYFIQITVHIQTIQIHSENTFYSSLKGIQKKYYDLCNLYPIVTVNKILYE